MKLHRTLGFWDVFCIAAGAMISSGLFVLPGLAFARAGPAVVLAYALASVMIIPGMLAKAELATAMPQSGGSYFFVERSMGALSGTLAGLAGWLSISLKSAFALVGIGAFAQLAWADGVAGQWLMKAVAIGFCLILTLTNILSVKGTGRLQVVMVAVLFAVLLAFVGLGLPNTRHARFANFMGKGWGNVLATAGLVFVSFGGLTKVASVAEEIRNPGRNIPSGMFLAGITVSLLYVATTFVAVGVLDPEVLSGSLTPLSQAAGQFLGKAGFALLAGAAMLAFLTTGNSGILSASRAPLAMSRDQLLPPMLRRISRRFGTPYPSILVTSGFMIAVIGLLTVENLVKVASTMKLMLFLLMNVAVLIMRGSKIQNYRPLYRMPLLPWLPMVGIGVYGFLIVEMTREMDLLPLMTTGGFVLAGTLWYLVYVRPRSNRESALVYMVRSVLSKAIYRSTLEEELKQIALERDGVRHDRFDRLIRSCPILDLPEAMTADELFRLTASQLAPRIRIPQEKLLELLREREAQSSTALQPGLAIPHVIVDGQQLFDVLLVRCRQGIRFPGADEPVQVAFVLIGSADERNFHLRALMAIAHIVQEPGFTKRWLKAPDAEHLRDIVLLSGRSRHHPER